MKPVPRSVNLALAGLFKHPLRPDVTIDPHFNADATAQARRGQRPRARHFTSLNAIVSVAILEPHPLVRRVRRRTVAKVDSIGLVVRKCGQRTKLFFR